MNPSAIVNYLGASKLVLASNNQGKIREFAKLLNPLGLEIVPQGDLNIPAAEEPFPTFIENALAKARHASQASGLPALADDSGICVTSLKDTPGIYSARYAGVGATDQENNSLLIKNLQDIENRSARYVCALVLVKFPTDPEPLVVSAQLSGQIIDEAQGVGGFGYDPHFYLPSYGQTIAQISAEVKNTISHRAIATKLLLQALMDQTTC
jgi:XTP/dITP diphosphohydrolase